MKKLIKEYKKENKENAGTKSFTEGVQYYEKFVNWLKNKYYDEKNKPSVALESIVYQDPSGIGRRVEGDWGEGILRKWVTSHDAMLALVEMDDGRVTSRYTTTIKFKKELKKCKK